MRLFIALEIPPATKESLSELTARLKKTECQAKWANPENFHLTLKFFGEVNESKIPVIKTAMTSTAKKLSSLEIRIEKFGFFPNGNNPKVFFLRTNLENELKALADFLEAELSLCGFEKEGRFKAHITLARFKGKENLPLLKEEIKNPFHPLTFKAEAITLFKSELTDQGAIHTGIYKKDLKK